MGCLIIPDSMFLNVLIFVFVPFVLNTRQFIHARVTTVRPERDNCVTICTGPVRLQIVTHLSHYLHAIVTLQGEDSGGWSKSIK
jgi:chloramphenicol 3-O-phosphotransferase